jgi:hypothetical protein
MRNLVLVYWTFCLCIYDGQGLGSVRSSPMLFFLTLILYANFGPKSNFAEEGNYLFGILKNSLRKEKLPGPPENFFHFSYIFETYPPPP